METLKKVWKITKVALVSVLFLGATFGLAGCATKVDQSQYEKDIVAAQLAAYNQGNIDGVNSVDITSDNADVIQLGITSFLDANEIAYELSAEDGSILLVSSPVADEIAEEIKFAAHRARAIIGK